MKLSLRKCTSKVIPAMSWGAGFVLVLTPSRPLPSPTGPPKWIPVWRQVRWHCFRAACCSSPVAGALASN